MMPDSEFEADVVKGEERESDNDSLSGIIDEIENLEPEKRREVAQFFFEHKESMQLQGAFTSPLPPPAMLRDYNELIPNGADRLMVMAEDQSRHRIRIESIVIQSDTRRSYIGLWLGFGVALAVLLTAGYAIHAGYPKLAGAVVAIDLVALASVFVYGSISRRSERASRRKLTGSDRESE